MKHSRASELIQLLLIDELGDDDRRLLEDHLEACSDCRAEMESMKRFHQFISRSVPAVDLDAMLPGARARLSGGLRKNRTRRSTSIAYRAGNIIYASYRARVPIGLAACLAIGIALGALWKSAPREERLPLQQTENLPVAEGDTRIGNVRFLKNDPATGRTEFAFDAVKSMRISGSVSDPQIQKILAQAVVSEQNAGVRLQSVTALTAGVGIDNAIKAALVTAVKSDDNAGVRGEALRALSKYLTDQEIMKTFVFVLTHEKNPGLRIAAINYLDSAKVMGRGMDNAMLRALMERSETDNNSYIRLRARTVLEEINQ